MNWSSLNMIRDVQNTWIWREKKREQYWFWWTDLCLFARNKPSEYSANITLSRGEFVMSEGFFQKRWNTTRMTLRTFFAKLLREKWISSRYVDNFKVIIIVNYDNIVQSNNNPIITPNNTEGSHKITDILDSKSATYEGQQPNNNPIITQTEANNNPKSALTNNIGNKGNRDNNKISKEIFVIGDADDAESADKENDPDKIIDLKKFMEYWNQTMQGKGLGKIIGIKNDRLRAIKARLREYGKQAIFQVVKKAAASNFLNNGKFNIDWIFKPNNFPKVLEGKYDNDRQIHENTQNKPRNFQGDTNTKTTAINALNQLFAAKYGINYNQNENATNTETDIIDADATVITSENVAV